MKSGIRRRVSGSLILLVEDDEDIRETVFECLVEEGYRVHAATHGAEALAWLREGGRPALVVLDLLMPVMNGAEFLASLRRDGALAPVPVLLMTAAVTSTATPLPSADATLAKFVRSRPAPRRGGAPRRARLKADAASACGRQRRLRVARWRDGGRGPEPYDPHHPPRQQLERELAAAVAAASSSTSDPARPRGPRAGSEAVDVAGDASRRRGPLPETAQPSADAPRLPPTENHSP